MIRLERPESDWYSVVTLNMQTTHTNHHPVLNVSMTIGSEKVDLNVYRGLSFVDVDHTPVEPLGYLDLWEVRLISNQLERFSENGEVIQRTFTHDWDEAKLLIKRTRELRNVNTNIDAWLASLEGDFFDVGNQAVTAVFGEGWDINNIKECFQEPTT